VDAPTRSIDLECVSHPVCKPTDLGWGPWPEGERTEPSGARTGGLNMGSNPSAEKEQ